MSNLTPVYVVNAPQPEGTLRETTMEVGLMLAAATSRLAIRSSGTLGRAEAQLGERCWAAKHYWTERPRAARAGDSQRDDGQAGDGDALTIFEFDEPLPAGPMLLRLPIRPAPVAPPQRRVANG